MLSRLNTHTIYQLLRPLEAMQDGVIIRLGLELGFNLSTLEELSQNDSENLLFNMIHEWLAPESENKCSIPRPFKKTLCEALRSSTLQQDEIAESIENCPALQRMSPIITVFFRDYNF